MEKCGQIGFLPEKMGILYRNDHESRNSRDFYEDLGYYNSKLLIK